MIYLKGNNLLNENIGIQCLMYAISHLKLGVARNWALKSLIDVRVSLQLMRLLTSAHPITTFITLRYRIY